jgi:hypothetical protein
MLVYATVCTGACVTFTSYVRTAAVLFGNCSCGQVKGYVPTSCDGDLTLGWKVVKEINGDMNIYPHNMWIETKYIPRIETVDG